MSTIKNKEKDLTSGALVPKIIMFALPLIATGILQLMFNAADLIVVGQFSPTGEKDIGAVGGTAPLINLVINLFIGLSIGTSVFVARYIGAGDKKKTEETVHTSIAVSLVGGVICFILGYFFAETFLGWMNTIDEYMELSTLYMKIYFIGIPACLVYNFGASILRAAGDTFHPLLFLTISGVANVILNLVMVIGFEKSVDGVAIASAVSQYISAFLVVWYLCCKTEGSYRLNLKRLRIIPARLIEIIRVGVPAGIQGALFSISNVIIQTAVNSFNSTAIASGSVASGSIEGFIFSAMDAFTHATLSFTGQHIGAGKQEKVGKIVWTCIIMVTTVGVVLGGLALLFEEPLLRLYIGSGDSADVIATMDAAKERLFVVAVSYFTCGIMNVLSGALRGMGASLAPMLICVIGVCGFRILWIFTWFPSHHTLTTLFLSYPISWILTVAAQFVWFIVLKRKMLRSVEIGKLRVADDV